MLAAALSVLAVPAACGPGSGPSDTAADSSFLSELHDSAPDIASVRSDTQLVRLGHAACDGFAAGASYVELADRLALQEGSHAIPSQDLGAVITAAVDNYCPKYRSRTS